MVLAGAGRRSAWPGPARARRDLDRARPRWTPYGSTTTRSRSGSPGCPSRSWRPYAAPRPGAGASLALLADFRIGGPRSDVPDGVRERRPGRRHRRVVDAAAARRLGQGAGAAAARRAGRRRGGRLGLLTQLVEDDEQVLPPRRSSPRGSPPARRSRTGRSSGSSRSARPARSRTRSPPRPRRRRSAAPRPTTAPRRPRSWPSRSRPSRDGEIFRPCTVDGMSLSG